MGISRIGGGNWDTNDIRSVYFHKLDGGKYKEQSVIGWEVDTVKHCGISMWHIFTDENTWTTM